MTGPDTGRLEDLVGGSVASLGLELDAVELSRAGSRRVLRVAVDADGGVPIDTITEATRMLSAALDAEDAMGSQPYTLEVTSRGVDRPLTLPRHWRRNVGRLVVVDLVDGSRVKGRIAATGDDDVELTVDSAPRRVALADVATARVRAELTRPQADRAQSDRAQSGRAQSGRAQSDRAQSDRAQSSPGRTTHPDKDV